MSDLDDAFAKAAAARHALESVVERVRTGSIDLAAAFVEADDDALTGRCFAVKVFEAVPGIGKVRARRTMEELGLDEGVWIRDVPSTTRSAVAAAFSADD